MKSFEEICPEWNRKIQEDGGIVVFTITPTPLDITYLIDVLLVRLMVGLNTTLVRNVKISP
jgi:hypothetical protein